MDKQPEQDTAVWRERDPRLLAMLIDKFGLSQEIAAQVMHEARLKIQAGATMGVAGFWS